MFKTLPIILLGVFASVLIACAGNSGNLGQKIATNECVECHANLITCMKLGRDKPYWEKTVQRMIDSHGMGITAEEKQAVTDYLTGLESGASPICD